MHIPTLDHIATYPNFLSPPLCVALARNVNDADLYQQGVLNNDGASIEDMLTVENREVRYVRCGTKYISPELTNSVIQTAVERFIEPKYRISIHYWEWPQLLVYPPDGGHYKPHVDSEYEFPDGWRRIADRDVTMLIYLNDDYEGGEVVFPDIGFTVRPKMGQIVCFPGDRRFRHGVTPVTAGERRTLVCWLTAWGTPRVTGFPPKFDHVLRGQYPSIK